MNAYIRIFDSVDAKIWKGLDLTIMGNPVVLCENSHSAHLVIDGGKLYNCYVSDGKEDVYGYESSRCDNSGH